MLDSERAAFQQWEEVWKSILQKNARMIARMRLNDHLKSGHT